jgi:hypothetical protein
MRYMAEKIHRQLRIPVLQLSVGGTHAAHRLDLTRRTLGDPGDLFPAHLAQEMIPPFTEAPPAEVIGIEAVKKLEAAD